MKNSPDKVLRDSQDQSQILGDLKDGEIFSPTPGTLNTTAGEFNELAQFEAEGNMDCGEEKEYIEQSNLEWRESKLVTADIINQLTKENEAQEARMSEKEIQKSVTVEQRKRPTNMNTSRMNMRTHQSFLLNTSFAPIKKPTATVETQTDDSHEVKNYAEIET